MKHGTRFALALCACLLVALCVLSVFVARHYYDQALSGTVALITEKAADRAEIKHWMYSKDKGELTAALKDMLDANGLVAAAVYNARGDLLAASDRRGSAVSTLPPLGEVRGDASITAAALVAFVEGVAQPSRGFSLALSEGEQLHLTLPIITTLNPTHRNLAPADFLAAAGAGGAGNSRNIMGYVHAALAPRELLAAYSGPIGQILGVFVAAALALGAIVFRLLGGVRKELAALDRLADEVAEGTPVEELTMPDNTETRKVTDAIKEIIRKAQESRNAVETERKMLDLQADESASRLSEQDDRLSRASEEIQEAKNKLREVTFYDSLTSLPNRALFQEQLQLLLNSSERGGQTFALLFLNLNNFGRVNDTFGYSTGDLVLTEVGKRLSNCLRRNDVVSSNAQTDLDAGVSRIGGDEFALILDQVDRAESAGKVAQRIIDQVTAPIQVADQEIIVSPSIGIAVYPRDAKDADGLTRAAGVAMNSLEASPKGAYLFYNEELVRDEQDQFRLESELRKAVERNQLQLCYQPQIDTADGSIVCAEALMRWEHPEFGEVPPSRFIPLAQNSGMMAELGHWCLLRACQQLKEIRASGLELPRVAINIEPEEVGADLTRHVREALEETGLSADSLELGLSEIVLMDSDSEEARALRELSELGVHISLDNFGISSTPLSHLNMCPINELKLDYKIVHNCDRNSRNASLVKAVIAVAQSLELRIVAAGVETQGEFEFLADCGARMLQGFLFSAPVSADELQKQLEVPWPYMSRIQALKMAHQGEPGA
ncbi:MAG: EAL domain-containing protein [Halioglobus sp.]|nr:EAL domain-containing protein [Halioglobus sp.]